MTALEKYDTLNCPDVIREAWTLAAKIASTDFVPQAFRGKPEAVMAAMLTGREVGLGPMSALQRIHVIGGRPCVDAQGQRALVLAAGHEIWQEETTPTSCTYAGRRAGSDNVQRTTWTLKDAERAGIANGMGWKKFPRQMLAARASAELCRMVAPDAIQGLGLTVEELEDERPATTTRQRRAATPPEQADQPALITVNTAATTVQPSWDDEPETVDAEIIDPEPVAPDRTVQHVWDIPADPEPAAEHPTEPTTPPATTTTTDPNLATDKQIRMLSAILNGRGLDEDQIDALILEHSASRTTSRKELTRTEASTLIDHLKATP